MTGSILAMLLFVLTQQQVEQPRKASIEGTVTNAISGDPLARAQVILQRISPPTPSTGVVIVSSSAPTIPPTVTERDGKFAFRDLEPGQYRLRVVRNGYAPQEYGQRTLTSSGVPVTLAEAQQLKDVLFRLTAAGVVTGRVRDANGEPVAKAQVALLRSVYNINGQRSMSSAGTATTDDRGEYRVFWAPPGRYAVSVSTNTSSLPIELAIANNTYSDRTFPTTYYPGTLDPARASTIDLQPGAEVGGIDFVLSQPILYKVRGRIVDSTTGQPPRSASINLSARQEQGTNAVLVSTATSTSNVSYNAANGTFEVRNVVPGTYWLRAQSTTNSSDLVDRNAVAQARTNSELLEYALMGSRNPMTYVPIEVVGQDLEGVVLTLGPGINIPVRLSVEAQEFSSMTEYDRVRVYLRTTAQSGPTANQRTAATPEGVSSIEGISPGEYRVTVSTTQPDYYLKEARFDGVDVMTSPWLITSRTSGVLNVVLSPKAGTVEGNLLDAASERVAGNLVVLIPDQLVPEQGRLRSELFRSATTDAQGRFTIRGIYPGSYRLYSWEALEGNSFFDPAVLAQFEPKGKAVRIQEGTKETVELRIIPAPK